MNALTVLMPGFVGYQAPTWLLQRMRDGLGGVCLFSDNVGTPKQVRALTDALYGARPTAIVSMDEEGGDVTRLYQSQGSPFPGNAVLGRLADADLTRSVGERVGAELAAAGVGLALGPDADINSNPDNPVIGVRSFGTVPDAVARHTVAWLEGVQSRGVAACVKHFPGHGDTAQDSHVALPRVDADGPTLHARELVPFRAAVEAGARTIMTSHIVVPVLDPDHPATFSHRILTGLLREEWGYDGAIVTDALDMAGASGDRGIPAAAVAALAAGADLLCIGTKNTDEQIGAIAAAIDAAVADGSLPAARLADAIARVEALGEELEHARDLPAAPLPPLAHPHDVQRAFYVGDHVKELLAAHPRVQFIALESTANVAVGDAPWGPFAAGVARAATLWDGGDIAAVIDSLDAHALPVLVGKDLHRHSFAHAAATALRGRGHALVVDMGWPHPDLRGIDIATFGASRLVGEALIDLIGRVACGLE